MDFTFNEDQEMFRDSVRGLLDRECSPETVRSLWETESGRSADLWASLAELGILGMLAPESGGGLDMNEVDMVLPLIETGRAALPGPVVESAAIATATLRDLGGAIAEQWLPRLATGEAIATVGHPGNAFVADAHVADLLLLHDGDALYALTRDHFDCVHQPGNDPSRKLFRVDRKPGTGITCATGTRAGQLAAEAFDRGAFGCAAQLVGVAQQLVDIAVAYAQQREQFGKPIGSFQAIKHMLATVQVKTEFAKPLLYRAANSLAEKRATASADVSQAKAACGEAAAAAAKTSLQVHGAIGYTWECDLQIWMKRAWSLDLAWGSAAWHRARVADAVLDKTTPAESFGFEARV